MAREIRLNQAPEASQINAEVVGGTADHLGEVLRARGVLRDKEVFEALSCTVAPERCVATRSPEEALGLSEGQFLPD